MFNAYAQKGKLDKNYALKLEDELAADWDKHDEPSIRVRVAKLLALASVFHGLKDQGKPVSKDDKARTIAFFLKIAKTDDHLVKHMIFNAAREYPDPDVLTEIIS